jgi:glutamine cyclotransferase
VIPNNSNSNGSCDASSSSSSSSCSSDNDDRRTATATSDTDTDTEERLLVTESTGMHKDSLLRIWDPATGIVHKETRMDSKFFGEGMTHFVDDKGNEKIVVLTYQEGSILIYDADSLQLLDTIEEWPSPTTTGEGWGIAFDPLRRIFVVTDGSEYLHFWNLDFEEISSPLPSSSSSQLSSGGGVSVPNKLAVRIEELVVPSSDGSGTSRVLIPRSDNDNAHENDNDNENENTHALPGKIIGHINELEWDASTGTLLANKWFEEVVLRIDPTTGVVTRVYDFSELYPQNDRYRPPEGFSREDVFNGIAILPNTDGKEWLLTGKYWPYMYRIRIKE